MMKSSTDENIIWKEFTKGSDLAFEKLYLLYSDLFYNYGLSITNQIVLVEDTIHDVFVQIYKNRTKLEHIKTPKSYLLIIFRNRLYTLLKKKEFPLDIKSIEPLFDTKISSIEDTFIQMEQKHLKSQYLQKRFKYLTPKELKILYYRYILNLSFKELSSIFHIKEQSAQNLLQRAIHKLKDKNLILLLFIYINKS